MTYIAGFSDLNGHLGLRICGLKMNAMKGWFKILGMVSTRDPMGNVLLKVSNSQTLISTWNKKVFGNVRLMLTNKRKELEQAELLSMSGGNHFTVEQLNEEIQKLVNMEGCMWKQWAKSNWLRDGDQNTKYFHCESTERNKRNYISGLENEFGEWIEEENQIGDL